MWLEYHPVNNWFWIRKKIHLFLRNHIKVSNFLQLWWLLMGEWLTAQHRFVHHQNQDILAYNNLEQSMQRVIDLIQKNFTVPGGMIVHLILKTNHFLIYLFILCYFWHNYIKFVNRIFLLLTIYTLFLCYENQLFISIHYK